MLERMDSGVPQRDTKSADETVPLRCIDFVSEIRNHPYPHPVSYQDNAWLVPQMSNREVLARIATAIPIDTPPTVMLDGAKPRWYLDDNFSVMSYTLQPFADQMPLFRRIADGNGRLFVGDSLGMKGEDDISSGITTANREVAGLSVAAVTTGAAVAYLRARKNTVSRRTFLKSIASGLGLAVVAYGGVASSVWIKQTSSFDSGCIGGFVDSYHANLLPRNVGGTRKFLDSELANRHGVWGTSHLKRDLVDKTKQELSSNPRDTATTALLLEARFISNLHMNTYQKIDNLALFVIDLTTSLQMAIRYDRDEVKMLPVANREGQFLTYHASVAPEGLERYNPVRAGGVVRREAFVNYASDILDRM